MHLLTPDPATLSVKALGLSVLAAVLLFVLHRGVLTTLPICSAVALTCSCRGLVTQ